MATRTAEKSAQLGALSSFPEGQRQKLAKQVINSAAVDLEQSAKDYRVTQFNRAKRDAVSAIDNVDRFAAGGIELLVELRPNFDARVSFFREQGITPAN